MNKKRKMGIIARSENNLNTISGVTNGNIHNETGPQGRIKFAVLQYIYAKCGGLHAFLKENGFNNQQHLFFLPTEIPATNGESEDRIAAYMMTNEGRMRTIKERKGNFYLVPNYDDDLRKEAARILKYEVEINGRSGFYTIMQDLKAKVLATNPLF